MPTGKARMLRIRTVEFRSALEVDAMFFAAAHRCLQSAAQSRSDIAKAETGFAKLMKAMAEVKKRKGIRAEEALERVAIQMESADDSISTAYAPYLENLAAAQIFAAACLESHINGLAKARLAGRVRAEFDRLALASKWLYLPVLLGLAPFDPGEEPFQSFDRLVGFRNRLLHYKGKAEPWQTPNVPSFLPELGLTEDLAGMSLACCVGMIQNLCQRLGQAAPLWLSTPGFGYFGSEMEIIRE